MKKYFVVLPLIFVVAGLSGLLESCTTSSSIRETLFEAKADRSSEKSGSEYLPGEMNHEPLSADEFLDAGEESLEKTNPDPFPPESTEATETLQETREFPQESITEPPSPKEKVPERARINLGQLQICRAIKQKHYKNVKAGKDRASAVEILVDHNAYVFQLTANRVGYFRYDAWRQRDHYFFLTRPDVKLEVEDLKGKTVPIKKKESRIRECKEIKAKYTLNLPNVAYYYFKLGPVSKNSSVIVMVDDGHGH